MLNVREYANLSVSLMLASLAFTYVQLKDYKAKTWWDLGTHLLEATINSEIRVLILINLALCAMFVLAKFVQRLFFGTLRAGESRSVNDGLLNYVLFKVVFATSILELLEWRQMLVCITWFSVIGFLKIFVLLSRERFRFLRTMGNEKPEPYRPIVILLTLVLSGNTFWFFVCFFYIDSGYGMLFLLTFECFLIFFDSAQTLISYFLQVTRRDAMWEARDTYVYYTEFATDSLTLIVTFIHYCHILFMNGISFTLIDAVLFLNMRFVFNMLKQKINSYLNYQRLIKEMNHRFPLMNQQELEASGFENICLICRERMEFGRKLPCSHIFHESCLRIWVENQQTCPTCRQTLLQEGENTPPPDESRGLLSYLFFPNSTQTPQNSFEVTPQMISKVQEVAGHVPEHAIRQDLARTGSVERTLENIFEGLVSLDLPPSVSPQNSSPTPSQPQSPSPLVNIPPQLGDVSKTPANIPSGFASSPAQRQKILEARKEELRRQSKMLYLKKLQERQQAKGKELENTNSAPDLSLPVTSEETKDVTLEDPREVRRRKLLEAAERRLSTDHLN